MFYCPDSRDVGLEAAII